jgi:hypothetical protein
MAELRKNSGIKSVEKLQAFTLFESVVAISIITVLIGLGTLIYSNLVYSENPIAFYQAKDQIDIQLHELSKSQAFFNREFDFETFRIEQHIEPYNGNNQLYKVTFLAFAGTKKLIQEQHLLSHD